MDQHIGQVMAALDQALGAKSFEEDLMIIISSDHGENQGELGIYAEHGTADHATCHIPLVIRWPGMTEGRRDAGLHYQLDLGPTLADLLNVPTPASWEGQSFGGVIRAHQTTVWAHQRTEREGADYGREFLVLSQCAHVCQRSVRWGPWLYMRTYHDGFRLLPEEMLFNLEEDPYEQENLAGELPVVCREGLSLLTGWHDEMMANMPGGPDRPDPLRVVLAEGGPTHARGVLAEYCQRLEATGRGQHIPELKRKHPREFTEC
jgi:arylsulfatase A-like enzyme